MYDNQYREFTRWVSDVAIILRNNGSTMLPPDVFRSVRPASFYALCREMESQVRSVMKSPIEKEGQHGK